MTSSGDRSTAVTAAEPERPTHSLAAFRALSMGARKQAGEHNVSMLAGGVAFFGFLALFPATIALLMLWGLVVTRSEAADQVTQLTSDLPSETQSVIQQQLDSVLGSAEQARGLGFVMAVLLALWSASAGLGNLVKAVNIAYDQTDGRGFLRSRGLALLLTLAAIAFLALAVGLIAYSPQF